MIPDLCNVFLEDVAFVWLQMEFDYRGDLKPRSIAENVVGTPPGWLEEYTEFGTYDLFGQLTGGMMTRGPLSFYLSGAYWAMTQGLAPKQPFLVQLKKPHHYRCSWEYEEYDVEFESILVRALPVEPREAARRWDRFLKRTRAYQRLALRDHQKKMRRMVNDVKAMHVGVCFFHRFDYDEMSPPDQCRVTLHSRHGGMLGSVEGEDWEQALQQLAVDVEQKHNISKNVVLKLPVRWSMSDSEVHRHARGIVPGDRWDELKETTPSGKTIFRCRNCGRKSPTPDKVCWEKSLHVGAPGSKTINTHWTSREPNLACVTWLPDPLYRYQLRTPTDWADFVVSKKGYFSSVSSRGDYAHYWKYHGFVDFRVFLWESCRNADSWDYFCKKLYNGQKLFDEEETEKAVRREILSLRRLGSLTKKKAREEWVLLEDHDVFNQHGFHLWLEETSLSDAYELARYSYPSDVVYFTKELMPALAKDLELELLREGLLTRDEEGKLMWMRTS